ncbi:type II secretion system protein [Candidatus Omnitrophota bacterium]
MKRLKGICNSHHNRIGNQAFTLLEIILVLVILSVIAVAGVRIMDSYDNAMRFQNTIERMTIIRDKIIGDERIVQSGQRVDFGYFGKHSDFPPATPPADDGLDALRSVWKTCDPYILAHDAWGARLSYDGPSGAGGMISIESPGSNGVYNGADAGFNTDTGMQIHIAHYTSNDIYIYCKDVKGTLLRGIVNGSATTYDYHIRRVTFVENGGTTYDYTSTAGGTLNYSSSGYWYVTGTVKAGQCTITVYPADGDGAKNCNTDRTNELGLSALQLREVVYPKGGFSNYNDNIYIVRFPGAVEELHP